MSEAREREIDGRRVRHGHALRRAGGTRGVDDVRDVLRTVPATGRLNARVVRDPGIVDAQLPRMLRKHVRAGRVGQHGDRSRIGQHERDAIRRVRDVEREIDAPGLEDREQRHDARDRTFERDADDRAEGNAALHKPPRERVRARVEFAVGERTARARHGARGGVAPRAFRDERVGRALRKRRTGGIPRCRHERALVRRRSREGLYRRVRIVDEPRDGRLEERHQRREAGVVEDVGKCREVDRERAPVRAFVRMHGERTRLVRGKRFEFERHVGRTGNVAGGARRGHVRDRDRKQRRKAVGGEAERPGERIDRQALVA